MTRNVGSRASCYPPDSVSFRRFAGARADCGLPRAYVVIARGAALPFGSLGLASGNTRSRAGVPGASSTLWQGIARYDGKAAPTRATLHQARSGKRSFSAAERSLDRGRSSETIFLATFFLQLFSRRFTNSGFCDFDRATTANRSHSPRVSARRRDQRQSAWRIL